MALSFWNEFTEWYRALCKKNEMTTLTELEINLWCLKRLIFASNPQAPYPYWQVLPIHLCQKMSKNSNLPTLSLPCKKKIDLEKYIATRENKLNRFNSKWKRLHVVVNIFYFQDKIVFLFESVYVNNCVL